jgi:ABC-type Fe3+-siderophore transport system permease subunit
LALVGIAVSAFCHAWITLLVVQADVRVAQALAWLFGSTYARGWGELARLFLWPLVLIPLAWVWSRPLNLLALGEDLPRTLGVRLERTRTLLLTVAVALAASAIASVGTLAFVGLIAPHAARLLTGGDHRRLIPIAGLLGAILVAAADIVGRTVLAPKEIPSGLVTSLIGTPYFIWLLWRSKRSALSALDVMRHTRVAGQ